MDDGFKLKERNKRQRSENCWSQNWSVWLSRMVHHDGLNNDADWVKRYMTMEVDGTRQERKSQWHCVKYDRKTVFFLRRSMQDLAKPQTNMEK